MIKRLFLAVLILSISLTSTPLFGQDAGRLPELDVYWEKMAKSVGEGDFETYKSLYHEDAVVIFATGENKTSVSIADALIG